MVYLLRDLKHRSWFNSKILFQVIIETKSCFSVDHIFAQFFDFFQLYKSVKKGGGVPWLRKPKDFFGAASLATNYLFNLCEI